MTTTIELNQIVKKPISIELLREYLIKTGWQQDESCSFFEKWRHPDKNAPMLNLSNALQNSFNSIAEFEKRVNYAVWQDVMRIEKDRNR